MFLDLTECGKRIARLRSKKGYTQEELAVLLGCDRSLISYVEVGKRGLSVDMFISLSEFFDVSLDYLVLGIDRESSVPDAELASLWQEVNSLVSHLQSFQKLCMSCDSESRR